MSSIVDSNFYFMSFSIRPGGCNDKTLWSKSSIGMNTAQKIPQNGHFLGDGSYNLREYMIIPFAHDNVVSNNISEFNLAQSRTRNPVECSFGALKARFPCLKTELDMGSTAADGIIIMPSAAVEPHNWCLRHEKD